MIIVQTRQYSTNSFEEISFKRNRLQTLASTVLEQILGANHTLPRTRPFVDSPKSASIRVSAVLSVSSDQIESARDVCHRARLILQGQPIWLGWI